MCDSTISDLCQDAENGRLVYSQHFSDQTFVRSQPNRAQIQYILCEDDAHIIEKGTDDPRGDTCLIWGTIESGRVGHLVSGFPPNGMIITVYWPDLMPWKWIDNYKRRV